MIVETTIILLIVVVVLLVVRSIRRKKKSTAISPDVVTSPSPVVSTPPVSNIESNTRDDLAKPTATNEPLSSLNNVKNLEEEILDTEYIEPEFTVKKSKIETIAEQLVAEFGRHDPQLDLSSYRYPPLEILNTEISAQAITEEELEIQKQRLTELFEIWRIGIQKITATAGPRSTLYEVVPSLGVRIAQIKQTENDLVLTLGVSGTKVIGHLPGKGTVGIEVPHKKPCMVSTYSILNSLKFKETKLDLPIVLGLTMFNEVYIADLATLPHLLISGATGQGKSVAINAILLSLLYKKHPSELKFILIDVNSLELNLYRIIERHFLAKIQGEDAIVTDKYKVQPIISSLIIELEERYSLMKKAEVRNIKEYNEKFKERKLIPAEGNRYLPYLVIVIDEFSGLITNSEYSLEVSIGKLSQQGRAVGIHLVISTQYAVASILTGGLKANFPARIAFRVSSSLDSNVILDQAGAEKLGGDGDMLLSDGSNIIRLQGPFVSTEEVKAVNNYIAEQRGYLTAFSLPDELNEDMSKSHFFKFEPDDRDPLFEEAAKLIVMHQQGSTSLIQRKLKLNYNRAGRIIDQL